MTDIEVTQEDREAAKVWWSPDSSFEQLERMAHFLARYRQAAYEKGKAVKR